MPEPPPPERERAALDDIARSTLAPGLRTSLVLALLLPLAIVAAAQVWRGDAGDAARANPGRAELAAGWRNQGAWAADRSFPQGLHRFVANPDGSSQEWSWPWP